jgi:hypothetical protein
VKTVILYIRLLITALVSSKYSYMFGSIQKCNSHMQLSFDSRNLWTVMRVCVQYLWFTNIWQIYHSLKLRVQYFRNMIHGQIKQWIPPPFPISSITHSICYLNTFLLLCTMVFSWFRVAWFLFICVVLIRSLFVLFLLAITLPVLDYAHMILGSNRSINILRL